MDAVPLDERVVQTPTVSPGDPAVPDGVHGASGEFGRPPPAAPLPGGTLGDTTGTSVAHSHVIDTLDALDDLHLAVDASWRITHANLAAAALLQQPRAELRGRDLWTVVGRDEAIVGLAERVMVERSAATIETDDDRFGGAVQVRAHPLPDGGLALQVRDIGDVKRAEVASQRALQASRRAQEDLERVQDALLERSRHDPLTGLLSRDEVVRMVARRQEQTPAHVLALDLDGFRPVNEALGYAAGDDLLCQVATRLTAVTDPRDDLARTAADDFVIVTDHHEATTVEACADRLLEALREPFTVAGQPIYLTASIGIAAIESTAGPQDPLHAADIAMHRAKADGRDRFAWYDAGTAAEISQRLQLAVELRGAMERDEFVLHYQPVYDLRTGRVSGAEALIRWEHPEQGLVAPGRFIPTAEATGVIGPMGQWALATAATRAAAWRRGEGGAGKGPPPILWVNVSLAQLLTPGFAAGVLQQLAAAGVEPSRLGLEVTESVLASDTGAVVEELSHLRRMGIHIALDDFGTGFSSLARLRTLPVDVLKIDQSFIRDLSTSAGRATVAAIVDLGHALDVQVIAEGVETTEELAELRRVGCDLAGGFLLARPVASAELFAIAEEGRATLTELLAATESTPDRGRRDRKPRRRREALRARVTARGDDGAADQEGSHDLGDGRALAKALTDHLDEGRRPVLLLIDLDGYRALQVMREPAVVDSILQRQAQRVAATPGASPYHLGEDLFALVLPDLRRGPVATQVDLVELAQGPKGMTACVGIAHATADSAPSDIERRARDALAIAKRRGHGSVVDGRPASDDGPSVTPTQARALYSVLREGYLRVHYQPIFSLADDAVIAYEALVRPQLDHGLSGPDEAFDIATHLGLVPDLDAVCRASIFADGPGFDMAAGTRLHVNIHPAALGHRSLRTAELRRQITNAGLEPDRVVFELREGPDISRVVFVDEATRLKERGFSIALEDAGGSGGDLRTLRSVPFDTVKLTPELLTEAREDRTAAATLDALCTFAHRAGIEIIATGIEGPRELRAAQTSRMAADGRPRVHAAQGYHLGKPRPQPR